MMLPILISVSPAPGSYFFWALAAVAAMASAQPMARQRMASADRLRVNTGIVSSLLVVFRKMLWIKCGKPRFRWQAPALFRCAKRHCWLPPFVIDQGATKGFSILERNARIGPRHPKLGAAGFRVAQWLAAQT